MPQYKYALTITTTITIKAPNEKKAEALIVKQLEVDQRHVDFDLLDQYNLVFVHDVDQHEKEQAAATYAAHAERMKNPEYAAGYTAADRRTGKLSRLRQRIEDA